LTLVEGAAYRAPPTVPKPPATQEDDGALVDRLVAVPATETQYHIALGPGEVAEYVLLPGDPDRVAKIAERFDSIELERHHREFVSITGQFRGQRMSAISTGIGTDNVEIVMAEILALTKHPTFIRIGSCGVLKDDIGLGELVITSGAVRLEATTKYFVHEGYPAVADYTAVAALVEAANRLGHRAHVGITATAPGFYGAQGRPIPQLPIRFPDLADEMTRQGVTNFEMEASAVLVLATLAKCRAGVVCTAYAQRVSGAFVVGEQKDRAEAACVETGLEALRLLADMDKALAAFIVGAERGILNVARLRTGSHRCGPQEETTRITRGRRTRGSGLLRQGQAHGRDR
jgi:uridine phosphorylase